MLGPLEAMLRDLMGRDHIIRDLREEYREELAPEPGPTDCWNVQEHTGQP